MFFIFALYIQSPGLNILTESDRLRSTLSCFVAKSCFVANLSFSVLIAASGKSKKSRSFQPIYSLIRPVLLKNGMMVDAIKSTINHLILCSFSSKKTNQEIHYQDAHTYYNQKPFYFLVIYS
tara:strand:- start:488 stop:853 length:366 start_codon:yes stop_codon:yes gene_type:complete